MENLKLFVNPLNLEIKELLATEDAYVNRKTKNLNSISILFNAFFNKNDLKKEHLNIIKAIKGFEAQTLMIDKILDNKKTNKIEMRIIVAFILQSAMTGDFLNSLKNLGIGAEDQLKAMKEWNNVLKHVYFGEGLDVIYTEKDIKPLSLEEYLFMIKETTAIFFQLPLYLGCLVKGLNEAETKKILDYGLNLGIAFQVKDDYEDLENDIEEGKQRIFVTKEALDLLSGENRSYIKNTYRKNLKKDLEILSDPKIKNLIKELNGKFVDKAISSLNFLEGNHVKNLKEIAKLIKI